MFFHTCKPPAFFREMRLHPKRTLIPFWAPGSGSQPESPWQVLPGYFALRMYVPEPFPKEGLGWKCPPCKSQENWISTQLKMPHSVLCTYVCILCYTLHTNGAGHFQLSTYPLFLGLSWGISIRGLPLGRALGHAFLRRNIQAELAMGIRVGSRFRGPQKG